MIREMEEGGSSCQKRVIDYHFGFIDIIISWSIEDIFNEDLFENKVEKIGLSFPSVYHYFGSYTYPLLEETRVRLCSSMEILSSAPFAEVIALDVAKPYRPELYGVTVESWRNRFTDRGKEPYKTLPGDILILAEGKPQTVDDLQRVGRFWTFVSVTNIRDDENEDDVTSVYFKVRAPKDIDLEEVCQKSLYVLFLTNVTTSRRIWNSLHMSGNLQLIEKTLCTDGLVEESCDYCSAETDVVTDKNSSSKLNESQNNAILACLSSSNCNHKPTVNLIWGPPGTGKTKTLGALLFALMKMNCRVLVCAPTNVAIKEVASRVMSMVRESFESEPNALFCPLGDMLLFGNKERLKVGVGIEDIYLDYRVKQLTVCFAPVTGWRSCFASTIDLLEHCVSHYHVHVENELAKKGEDHLDESRETKGTNNSNLNKEKPKSFLEFVRERFRSATLPLKECISILCTHVARSYILEHNFQNMVCLIEILDSFQALLFENDILNEGLEEVFTPPEVLENSALSFTGAACKLYEKRAECLSALRVLKGSLGQLDLPTSMSDMRIKNLCFRSSSLMFSTASSSYSLHSMDMEPLNILVIDEAAQLKECESIIPLLLPGINHAILVGDECQLPATVESNVSSDVGFGRSLFERLSTLGHSKHLLNIQYRMHPSISSFPNSYFYFNEILDAPNVKRKNYVKKYLPWPLFGPYSFINITGGREEFDDARRSRKNMVEVAVVVKILKNLYKVWLGTNEKLSIGIVSPYAAQVVAIQEKLGQKYDGLTGFEVNIKSIDGFQGGEQDIIILSTVRTNSHSSLKFISSPQRTNVAITRARYCLWILGDGRTLTYEESVWKSLVHNARNRQCFFNADEDKDMAKAILDVKKDLDQLDDLLNPDSAVFRNARWKVLFSDNFLKSFKMLQSQRIKKSVISLLLRLSAGWRPRRRNIDSIRVGSSQILKQIRIEGLYVICGTDIEKESSYTQVLKIWDVLPLDEIPKLVKRLDGIFGRFTDDFISRCMEKCFEGNLEVPMSWEKSTNIIRYNNIDDNENEGNLNSRVSDCRSYVENSKVGESLLLMKFYSLSSNIVSHLLSNRDIVELDLPFQGTDEETEIILYPRSTFILGRSGTGKTTVLTMKLFQQEYKYHVTMDAVYGSRTASVPCLGQAKVSNHNASADDRPVLRQLFVTVSPKLCHAVKHHVSRLTGSIFGGHGGCNSEEHGSIDEDVDDTELTLKNIPDSFADLPPNLYPLVITFQKFLMMLDGTLGNSYFERFHDMNPYGQNLGLRSVAFETFLRKKEVNYDRFTLQYWPHFNSSSTKKLDSSKVFTEIITHIKGGIQAAEYGVGKLSREEYLHLSEKRSSSLNRQKRETIYDIYQNYEKMKMENGEFDMADIVIDIHHRLRNNKYQGDEIQFVYIDEVQDLTMSQIALFKYICQNVEEGFVFSGDTAQTIARGIDFRFQDIRSLFYKKFVLESKSSMHNERKEKGQISDILLLTQNFRTHDGVLKLSQSILELIFRFFPHSIDALKPETSLIYGEAPVVLEPGNSGDAIVTIFGNSGNAGGKIVGFGAEQVILVRDDCARNEISYFVGKHALVLTILECKGLEFQDVLLYNFFGSSPLKNRWRVIYEYMNEQNLLDSTAHKSYPSFNDSKHNVLCSELKQLYVAVTRTRQRLWICENKEEFSTPMFDYWIKKCLVQVKQLDDSLAQAMKVASSPEEWKSRGIKLYHQNNYEMATMCFERAGDLYWENKAKAAGLKANANRLRDLDPENSSKILREAAIIFEEIGMNDSAAQCYSDLGDYERAGKLYLEKCGEPDLKSAGECFFLAKCYEIAAEVFDRGNYFSNCLKVCEEGRLFDIGFDYIQHWKQSETASSDVVKRHELDIIEQKFLESCALHYHQHRDTRSMLKAVKAFHSMDSKRKFLNSLGLLEELLMLEEEMGNFWEAANIAKQIGDILREADLLGKAGNFSEASTLVLSYVLANSLWCSGSKGWPLKKFAQKDELLRKAKLLAKRDSSDLYELVCTEADIVSEEQSDISKIMTLINSSRGHNNAGDEIICLRKLLDVHFKFDFSRYSWHDELFFDSVGHMEGMILRSQLSVETLFYCWSCWKDKIAHILEYLPCLKTHGVNENKNYGRFALNYLGVRKHISNLNDNFSLLIPDADWLTKIDSRNLKKNGKLVSIDVHLLVSASQSYWCSELFSVGTNVLRTLEALYKFTVSRNFSNFCKSRALMTVYTVSKFLLESELFNHSHGNKTTLESFIRLPIDNIFYCIFPLDWRESLVENVVSLRAAKVCQDMLREITNDKIMQHGRLTYGHIGRMTVMIMGSGKPSNKLCVKIRGRLHRYSLWNEFFQEFHANAGPEIPKGSEHFVLKEALKELQLTVKLHEALTGTYNVNWVKEDDYISPNCFLYLIERLLIWTSYPNGFVFTTKSSLVEWLLYQDDSALPNLSFMANVKPVQYIHDFIARVLSDLLFNKKATIEWIRKSGINVNQYYPLLVLRSVVALCLVHMNSGKCLHILHDLLGRGHITGQLPWEFFDVLRKRKKYMSIQVFAEAFKKVDNPLVCMRLWNTSKEIICQEAIFVDLTISHDRKDVLQMLFPKRVQTNHCQTVNAVSETTDSTTSEVVSSTDSSWHPNSISASASDKIMNTNLPLDCHCLLELLETLQQATNKADQFRLPYDSQQSKDNVDKSIQLLNASITGSSLENLGKDGFGEMKSMIDELKQLSAVLSDCNPMDKNLSVISELSKKILSKGAKVKHILNQLFLQQINSIDYNETLEASTASGSNHENHLEAVKESSEGSQGNINSKSETSKVNGKGKKNKSNKGGKKKGKNGGKMRAK